MAITKQVKPYEFLARWDHVTGEFKGAHIQHFEGIFDDGVMLTGQPGKAMGVGEDLAFPLSDIMSQIQADALVANAALQATVAERDATIAGHAEVIQARDQALTRVAELEALLAISQADDLPAAIRAERDRRVQAGVKVGADWFDTKLQTQIQYLGMLLMGGNLDPVTPLYTLDGRNVGATSQRVGAIFQSAAAQQAALYTIAEAAITAGTPLDQIQWPDGYTPAPPSA